MAVADQNPRGQLVATLAIGNEAGDADVVPVDHAANR